MTCAWTSTSRRGLVALLGLAGCQMINPAFGDEANADEVGDSSSSDSGSSSETGSTGSTGSTGTDATDATDSSDLATDSSEGVIVDMPSQDACAGQFHLPYSPVYGTAADFDLQQCQPMVTGQQLKVTGPGPVGGLVRGKRCGDGCLLNCDGTEVVVGVPGLDDFSTLVLSQNPLPCIKVQAAPLVGTDGEGRCLYDSLWVGTLVDNLMLAARRMPVVVPAGISMLSDYDPPSPGLEHVPCTCSELFEPANDDLTCCTDSMLEPIAKSLAFLGVDVVPGASATVSFTVIDYTFHVAQAQQLITCDNDDQNVTFDQSWALVRLPG